MLRVDIYLFSISIIVSDYLCLQAARPLVSVYNEKGEATETTVKLPAVFRAPIRPDIVNFIHSEVRKNSRQPYAVSQKAGMACYKMRPAGCVTYS